MKANIQIWFVRMSSLCVIAFCCSALVAQDDDDGPTLTIGSQAPQIDIEHWLSNGKGHFKPVTEFEPGHIYIVEFWATWCGPCIAAMPHAAEIQEKYADKHVQFIGVSDEDLPTVEEFLQKRLDNDDDKPTYGDITSAYSLTTDPDRSVYEDYMFAAGQYGIPNAFIVGKSGLIEWVGHPMAMDKPLQKVIDDQWDRDAYLPIFKAEQQRDYLQAKIGNLAASGKVKEALAYIAKKKLEAKDDAATIEMLDGFAFRVKLSTIARKLDRGGNIDDVLVELDALANESTPEQKAQIEDGKISLLVKAAMSDPKYVERAVAALTTLTEKEDVTADTLNMFAWTIFEASQVKENFPKPLLDAATAAAERGVKVAPDDVNMIDTLAHLVYIHGDLQRAIDLQTTAVNKAIPEAKAEYQKFLDKLTAERSE